MGIPSHPADFRLDICVSERLLHFYLHHLRFILYISGVSRKLATFEKMTVTGMNLRDLNVLLLHYPFMSNPRYCLGL